MSFNKKTLSIIFGILFLVCSSGTLWYYLTDDFKDAKFRTMQDKIDSIEGVSLTGLSKLSASGAPMMDFFVLTEKLSSISKPIIIVDTLMEGTQENYGYLKDGTRATYFAYELDKKPDVRFLLRRLLFTGTLEKLPELIVHEREMAQKNGYGHVSIRLESKSGTPDKAIDEFVAYFDKAPENTWFHFHCRRGKGRTTLALTMFDIMHNAPEVALQDIVKRQFLLGGVDLFDTTMWHRNNTYKQKALEDRKRFVEEFYTFICERKEGGIQVWSKWKEQRAGM